MAYQKAGRTAEPEQHLQFALNPGSTPSKGEDAKDDTDSLTGADDTADARAPGPEAQNRR